MKIKIIWNNMEAKFIRYLVIYKTKPYAIIKDYSDLGSRINLTQFVITKQEIQLLKEVI